MLTEKDYCDYETSRKLKELGFVAGLGEDNCGYCLYDDAWHDQVDRPLLYEAQKWLREEKRICVEVDSCAGGYVWELCKAYHTDWFSGGTTIYTEEDSNNPLLNDCGKYDSFEVALLEGIKGAVKILKENETIHR
jgi:hypothetical protein